MLILMTEFSLNVLEKRRIMNNRNDAFEARGGLVYLKKSCFVAEEEIIEQEVETGDQLFDIRDLCIKESS